MLELIEQSSGLTGRIGGTRHAGAKPAMVPMQLLQMLLELELEGILVWTQPAAVDQDSLVDGIAHVGHATHDHLVRFCRNHRLAHVCCFHFHLHFTAFEIHREVAVNIGNGQKIGFVDFQRCVGNFLARFQLYSDRAFITSLQFHGTFLQLGFRFQTFNFVCCFVIGFSFSRQNFPRNDFLRLHAAALFVFSLENFA